MVVLLGVIRSRGLDEQHGPTGCELFAHVARRVERDPSRRRLVVQPLPHVPLGQARTRREVGRRDRPRVAHGPEDRPAAPAAAHDPRAAAEQLDILHMASDTPLARGDLPFALAFSRTAMHHPLANGAMHVLHRERMVAHCLAGSFDEGLEEATALRTLGSASGGPWRGGWHRPTYLATLAYGLRANRVEADEWWRISDQVCIAPDNAMRAFATLRLALHEGRLDDAVAEIARHQRAARVIDSAFPWSAASLGYEGYLWSAAIEVWAVIDEPGSRKEIGSARASYAEHLWATPALIRAEARLFRDPERVRRAAEGFATIGARFEEAATLALLDSMGRRHRSRDDRCARLYAGGGSPVVTLGSVRRVSRAGPVIRTGPRQERRPLGSSLGREIIAARGDITFGAARTVALKGIDESHVVSPSNRDDDRDRSRG